MNDPKERATARNCLDHVWIAEKAPRASKDTCLNLANSLASNLRKMKGQSALKKAAGQIIAHQLDSNDLKQIREQFQILDTNGDGILTYAEIQSGLSSLGGMPKDMRALLETMDANGNDQISYTEFIAGALDQRYLMEEDHCWKAFNHFDTDGNGKITFDELEKILCRDDMQKTFRKKTKEPNVFIKNLIEEFDADGDGQIDFQEFLTMMRSDDSKVSQAG